MNKKVSELDLTKARLRLLEQSVVSTSSSKSENSSKNQDHSDHHHPTTTHSSTTTTTKSENHRVHFDLNNATTTNSTEIRKPARTSRPNGRSNNVHLPSDARQKLEQLVSLFKTTKMGLR